MTYNVFGGTLKLVQALSQKWSTSVQDKFLKGHIALVLEIKAFSTISVSFHPVIGATVIT